MSDTDLALVAAGAFCCAMSGGELTRQRLCDRNYQMLWISHFPPEYTFLVDFSQVRYLLQVNRCDNGASRSSKYS